MDLKEPVTTQEQLDKIVKEGLERERVLTQWHSG